MIQKIEHPNNGGMTPDGSAPRVETGAVQFGGDWPGLFIRGDDAYMLARHIETLQNWYADLSPEEHVVNFSMVELDEIKKVILDEVIQK